MNTALLLAGLFFFLNPNVSIFDPIPDFIGALLILVSVYRISKIDEHAKAAFRSFLILFGVSFAQALSCLLYFVIEKGENTWYLVLAMCFGIAESVIFIIAIKRLFSGISYRAMKADCPELYETASFENTTIVFAIFKGVFSFLPDLTFLSSDYGFINTFEINLEFLYLVLVGINVVTVLSVGIAWFVKMRKYFARVNRNGAFLEYVNSTFIGEYYSNIPLVTYERVKLSAFLLSVSLVFTLPLRFSGIDFLPDFVSAIAIFFSMIILKKFYKSECKKVIVFDAVYFAISLCEWIFSTAFALHNADILDSQVSYSEMLYGAFLHEPQQYTYFMLISAVFAIKAICLGFVLYFINKLQKKVILAHTGVAPEVHTERAEAKNRKMHRKTIVLLTIALVLVFVCSIFDTVTFALTVEFSTLWAIDFTLSLVSVVMSIILLDSVKSGIENKYFYL